jgi:uncharacterized protein YjbI with pentapeptide repeats
LPILGELHGKKTPGCDGCRRWGDIEVKWGCPCEEFCPSGDGCVLEVEVMTAEELLERYAAGERDFSGVDLGGSRENRKFQPNLSNADLRGINLCGANLEMVNMSFSNLSGARLFGACFFYSILYGTNFTDADLRYATINRSRCKCANFTGADMQGIDLTASTFFQTIWSVNNLKDAIMIDSNFADAQGWGRANSYNALYWGTRTPTGLIEGPERGG